MPDHLKPFQFGKGTSGNPGGRPKGLERTAREAMRLREYTAKDGKKYIGVEASFHCLIDMFFDEGASMRERIVAFREWCDRGYGKAKQSIKLDGDAVHSDVVSRKPEEMTDEDLAKALAAFQTLRTLGAVASDDVPEH